MKRRNVLLASIIFIAAWQLLAMAIRRDILPTLLLVARTAAPLGICRLIPNT